MVTSVVEALERDLTAWTRLNPTIGESALAALALRLAADLDNPRTSANAASMVSNSLTAVLRELREMVPESAEKDVIDDIAEQRAKRLSRSARA